MGRFKGLWARLSLAFLLVTWAAIGLVALIVRQATEANFRNYINQQNVLGLGTDLIADLEAYYTAHAGWEGAEAVLPGRGARGGEAGQGPGRGDSPRGAQLMVADPSGLIRAATDDALVGTAMSGAVQGGAVPIIVDGVTVGLLGQETPGRQALGSAEARFLTQTANWLGAAAIGAGGLAVAVGALLAWGLTRPLHRLTAAVRDLSAGGLGRQVPVSGSSELAELAQAFNAMSRDLAAGEQQRQRMAADVAHELRTPVSVLRGHLEAMLDGVLPPDGAHLAVALEQTIHLARLVDDLRLLTMAEAGRLPLERAAVPPGDLVHEAVASFAPLAADAGITLSQHTAPALPPVLVDADRIQQVLGNLLSNAVRHTPAGGQIQVAVEASAGGVRFTVRNSGQGLTPEEVAHIFDRFWRADEARAKDEGGSGLGLAIARQLVQLHGGRIWAESAAGEVAIMLELPAAG